MNYKCIDCFCGAGGLSLGLSKAGFELLYSFDLDHKAIDTMRSNPKYIPTHPTDVLDIYDLDVNSLLLALKIKSGELDLLAGGPPCQGFSIQRIGSDEDDRNNLVSKYIEVVKSIKPKFFLMENVPGIVGKRGAAILQSNLDSIAEFGYFIHQRLLDAQNFDVPQRRKRIIIIGERKDHAEPIFRYPKPSTRTITVRETIGFFASPA